MKFKGVAVLAAALTTTALVAPAEAATTIVNFSGSINGLGDYSADVTLDVVDGQAVSGTGTIDVLGKTRDLGLVTTATPGNIDESASYPGFPVGFRSNGGDDVFGADTAFPLTTIGGLLFTIGTKTPQFGQNALINFYNDSGTLRSVAFGFVDDVRVYNAGGTLNVTVSSADAPGAVPEPATWAMMLVGFGGIGFAMRRRRSKVTTKIAYA